MFEEVLFIKCVDVMNKPVWIKFKESNRMVKRTKLILIVFNDIRIEQKTYQTNRPERQQISVGKLVF